MLPLLDDRNTAMLGFVVERGFGDAEIAAYLFYSHRNVSVLLYFVLLIKFIFQQIFHTCDSLAQFAYHFG